MSSKPEVGLYNLNDPVLELVFGEWIAASRIAEVPSCMVCMFIYLFSFSSCIKCMCS